MNPGKASALTGFGTRPQASREHEYVALTRHDSRFKIKIQAAGLLFERSVSCRSKSSYLSIPDLFDFDSLCNELSMSGCPWKLRCTSLNFPAHFRVASIVDWSVLHQFRLRVMRIHASDWTSQIKRIPIYIKLWARESVDSAAALLAEPRS